SELRQLVWPSGTATCGAFAPDSSVAVTGTQDHQVLVWTMPSPKELEEQVKGRLVLVERALDTRNRQGRVRAAGGNSPASPSHALLIPGGTATLVVVPPPAPLPLR